MPEQIYTEGKIISNSWGYEQTNIDFYKIIKRKGEFVTLQPLKSIEKSNGALTMTGTCIPGEPDPKGKTIRRKVHYRDGRESGLAIQSHGWASLWGGEPEHFSSYG
ncbi:hypothetical protein LCGC14_1146920 [marine sediment metagenome]|uniref:Uncharacterized protein n=1 Tax=marine sediment metagenome TaxID=412755 RepID=A0A0F9M1I0_9ZZZZ